MLGVVVRLLHGSASDALAQLVADGESGEVDEPVEDALQVVEQFGEAHGEHLIGGHAAFGHDVVEVAVERDVVAVAALPVPGERLFGDVFEPVALREEAAVQGHVRGQRLEGRAHEVDKAGVGEDLEQRAHAHRRVGHLREHLPAAGKVDLAFEAAFEEAARGEAAFAGLFVVVDDLGQVVGVEGDGREEVDELGIEAEHEEHFFFFDRGDRGLVACAFEEGAVVFEALAEQLDDLGHERAEQAAGGEGGQQQFPGLPVGEFVGLGEQAVEERGAAAGGADDEAGSLDLDVAPFAIEDVVEGEGAAAGDDDAEHAELQGRLPGTELAEAGGDGAHAHAQGRCVHRVARSAGVVEAESSRAVAGPQSRRWRC